VKKSPGAIVGEDLIESVFFQKGRYIREQQYLRLVRLLKSEFGGDRKDDRLQMVVVADGEDEANKYQQPKRALQSQHFPREYCNTKSPLLAVQWLLISFK